MRRRAVGWAILLPCPAGAAVEITTGTAAATWCTQTGEQSQPPSRHATQRPASKQARSKERRRGADGRLQLL
eukprot:3192249-Alexandrium_andersonii.AAC.1